MKKLYATLLMALAAMTSFAQEQNDTTYVMMDFTQNPWNYPVREVTSGWRPDMKDWDAPGALLDNTDFSWPVGEGSAAKVKVTLYAVDLDEYQSVPVFGRIDAGNEASALGVTTEKMNVLYTTSGVTMRFEAPQGYKFGKMVFYTYRSSNFLVGDDYEEEYEYTYGDNTFTQKLKVWTPDCPKQNQYGMNCWEGDETNILFNYPYFSAHFVKIDLRLVPAGAAAVSAAVSSQPSGGKCYDLQGRALGVAPNRGIYIAGGKKILK